VEHNARKLYWRDSKKGDSSKGGGDKESKGKSDSSGKKGWSKDYEEKNKKDTFLPQPKSIPNSLKRLYVAAIQATYADEGSEEEASSKKKSKKNRAKSCDAEESD
jgi:hypothetical protein